MITSSVPTRWQDLQVEVAKILVECGFEAEVDKPTPQARGTVNIDVWAQETMNRRTYTVLCECKRWSTSVPKSVVHSFRTVVAEAGANLGYIITSKGFQSGAYDAAELTNLKLLTWTEFQQEFEADWIERYLKPTLNERLSGFMALAEPLRPRRYFDLSSEQQNHFEGLWHKYQPLNALAIQFSPYLSRIVDVPDLALPLKNWSERLQIDGLSSEITGALGYRELLAAMIDQGLTARDELRQALIAH